MQALLSLIDTSENAQRAIRLCAARQMAIMHRTHEVILDEAILNEGGFSTDFGGYGSYSRVGVGATFRDRWKISGLDEPRQQVFSRLTVYFNGSDWVRPLQEQIDLVIRCGGLVAEQPESADIVVEGKNSPALTSVPDSALLVNELTFLRALPAVRKPSTGKAPGGKKLSDEAAALWRLLSMRDESSIRQGLILAFGLDSAVEELLIGTEVNAENGELMRNKRFSGSGVAQPFLDAALYGLLSNAAEGSLAGQLRSEIRKVDISLPFLPELTGFDALQELELRLEDDFNASNLQDLGRLPCLKSLSILPKKDEYGHWGSSPVLSSLDGLDAPVLEKISVVKTSLKDCNALSDCGQLKSVDFSLNRELSDIDGLAACADSLTDLVLRDCEGVSTLDPVANATQLKRVDLCGSGITSVSALSNSGGIEYIDISSCPRLTSLRGLEDLVLDAEGRGEFSVYDCESLTSLVGLPKLGPSYQCLNISDLHKLASLDGIESASCVSIIKANGAGISDLSPLSNLQNLKNLDFSDCPALTDVSALAGLKQLESVDLSGCFQLKELPAHWAADLQSLEIRNCAALRSLGALPASLLRIGSYSWRSEHLELEGLTSLESLEGLEQTTVIQNVTNIDLSGCNKLTSLRGLEKASGLEMIALPASVVDAKALQHCRNLKITIDASDLVELPMNLVQALEIFPRLSLVVSDGRNLEHASVLAHLQHLESLDLGSCAKIQDLNWLIGLAELRELKLPMRNPLVTKLKLGKGDNLPRVRKLQQQLCVHLGLPLPSHLSVDKPAQKGSGGRKPGALSLRELKPLLTALDLNVVGQGLARLRAEGDPHLYDQLIDGCDSSQAFSSDSEAIGKIFKAVKASFRPMARWVLVSILAAAPKEASQAVALRESMRDINLDFRGWGANAEVPGLTGFIRAEKISLIACPATSLLAVDGLKELRELSITDAPNLTSLQGLEAAKELSKISLSNCQKLKDLSALAGKNSLSKQGHLDFSTVAPIENLDFMETLGPLESLEILVTPSVDLGLLREKQTIAKLTLHCLGGLPELSSLVHVKELEYYQAEHYQATTGSKSRWPHGGASNADESPSELLTWHVELPQLESLTLNGGMHDFSSLLAPNLRTLVCWGIRTHGATILPHLRGLAQVTDFTFYSTRIASLDGLQGSQVTELNLGSLEGTIEDLTALRDMPALRTLTLPRGQNVLTLDALQKISGCSQIEHLSLPNYVGSLDFLTGWDGLRILDLQNSGMLIDLEVLIALPLLETVLLRGAQLKRDSWPEALQSKLEYVRVRAF